MSDQIIFDDDYFYREVTFWEQTSERLQIFWGQFNDAAEIPSLSPHVSDWLNDLVPALNKAKGDMSHNMHLGYLAADAIAEDLVEVAKRYGMTEEEAEQIAQDAS